LPPTTESESDNPRQAGRDWPSLSALWYRYRARFIHTHKPPSNLWRISLRSATNKFRIPLIRWCRSTPIPPPLFSLAILSPIAYFFSRRILWAGQANACWGVGGVEEDWELEGCSRDHTIRCTRNSLSTPSRVSTYDSLFQPNGSYPWLACPRFPHTCCSFRNADLQKLRQVTSFSDSRAFLSSLITIGPT